MSSLLRWHKGILRTDLPTDPKSMNIRREEIEHEASGDGLRERGMRGVVEGSVVEWDEDGSHKLALLNLLNRGRQPASWNWCPAHPVGFSPVSYISYFIDPTHPPLPIILLPTEPLL